jgi:hypothetical protein
VCVRARAHVWKYYKYWNCFRNDV